MVLSTPVAQHSQSDSVGRRIKVLCVDRPQTEGLHKVVVVQIVHLASQTDPISLVVRWFALTSAASTGVPIIPHVIACLLDAFGLGSVGDLGPDLEVLWSRCTVTGA